jgi:two-component system nitrogen regulation sensor histidine kinase NtrY
MTLLASDSPESATVAPAGMRSWAGTIIVVAAVLLLAMLGGLIVEINNQASAGLTPKSSIALMLVILAGLLVAMALIVIRRAIKLWQQARNGLIGTRLQSRIILMFCVIAILPTLIVAVFSALFFNFGVQAWFDNRVAGALEDSVRVASAYLDEHKTAIRTDAVGLGSDIQRQLAGAYSNPAGFQRYLTQESASRNLSEAVVFDRNRVIARTALSFSLIFERLPEIVMDRADQGHAVIFGEDEDKIQAVVRISAIPELYLMVGRVVDSTVMDHMKAARTTVVQYRQLKEDITSIQRQFFSVFVLVALLVLLASIWAGMMLAVRLIGPIAGLMGATERVRAGDYSIRVPEGRADDEIANLARTFNRMTAQLEAQRRDLVEASRQIDERRRFTEAVLSGVSAGIIALDSTHRVTLHNRVARELLNVPPGNELFGMQVIDWLPELAALLTQAERKPEKIASGNMTIMDGDSRTSLHVQVTAERFNDTIEGYIVTFDDISELVSAQRSAAWADVARRIAHEIKNPLTPITLSVDRLRKKFGEQVASDKEGYERYLETISRHVRDIGRMVEEFVSFARLPTANFRDDDLVRLIRTSVFSEQTVHPDIRYTLDLPAQLRLTMDESQLGQVLLNLLKNAAEALDGADKKEIRIQLRDEGEHAVLTLEDSGPGFPPEHMERLTEPYVTTRAKGTGLGLAIVKRSVEEHKGTLALANLPGGGAQVTLTFAKKFL